jgi:hypothetical protein
MNISKTWRAIVGAAALGVAANASAVPVAFDLADAPESSVAITSLSTACLGGCGASVALNPLLDSLSTTLSAGQSWSFDFFSINFHGIGVGSGTLAASLAFDAPTDAPNAVGSGVGAFLSAGFLFSAGALSWISQPGLFSLADGTSYTVLFEDLVGVTVGSSANVRALLTLNTEPTGVPEPGTLALFGLGLLGLGFAKRMKRKA